MSQTVRFQETLRRLAIFDEGFAEAGFASSLDPASALDAKTVALLQVAASVVMGSSAACLEWSAARALAAAEMATTVATAHAAVAAVISLRV